MDKFHQLNLPKKLLTALETMKFKEPTQIQAETIPVALDGQDVLGTAQTGTGKTGAFAIPLSAKLLSNQEESLLVLTPTRELATQVISVFHKTLSEDKSIRTALLIGGEPIQRQFKQLKARPRVIVGTPGRINDHLERRTVKLHNVRSLVLDETDLMLDMGFDVQIAKIIDKMPKERQTLMFSATLPRKIESMASKYLKEPVRLSVGKQSTPGQGIEQETLVMPDTDKYSNLIKQLDKRDGSVIIFVKTKRGADRLSVKLNKQDHKSGAIHGDLRQSKRDRVLADFRKEKYRIMVATDVAARGIDVPHIRHVINYDLPQCPEDYIHRIGRTARAGEKGYALSFITKQEKRKWQAIERLLDPNAKHEPYERSERPRKPGKPKRFGNKNNNRGKGNGSGPKAGGYKAKGSNDNGNKKRVSRNFSRVKKQSAQPQA